MAATFDPEALQKMGDMTSSEGRALFNEDLREGKTGEIYRGLTYWTPNINIFRDPRWGRGQETYGEDPYLTAKMGSAIVRGLEGNDPYYLKAVACAKHYAVHSGPEHNRHSYDARVSMYDLWDTYLPAFRELVTKAKYTVSCVLITVLRELPVVVTMSCCRTFSVTSGSLTVTLHPTVGGQRLRPVS